ncbi:HAD hydrolase family protein [Paraclostridium bifermentans]|nr:HAD hydrolase family protein [Paraclostridium bifermentans]
MISCSPFNKVRAVESLAKYLNIEKSEIITFGDIIMI